MFRGVCLLQRFLIHNPFEMCVMEKRGRAQQAVLPLILGSARTVVKLVDQLLKQAKSFAAAC